MQTRKRAFPFMIALLLAACSTTSAPERQSQRDPNFNIGALSTFGWQTSTPGEGASDLPSRTLESNIRKAITTELTRRGYKEAEANPDLLVAYEIAAQEKVKSSPFSIGIGMGSWGSSGGGGVSVGSSPVKSYREGRLVIHAIDAAANQEVWFGAVSKAVDKESIEADAVARVVALAMEDFPFKANAP